MVKEYLSIETLAKALGNDLRTARVCMLRGTSLKNLRLKHSDLRPSTASAAATSSSSKQRQHGNEGISPSAAEETISFPTVVALDASRGFLEEDPFESGVLDTFPSLWWVNLSHCPIDFGPMVSARTLPKAMGRLDLRGASVNASGAARLSSIHILRLAIDENLPFDTIFEQVPSGSSHDKLMRLFPFAWTINGEYILFDEFKALPASPIKQPAQSSVDSSSAAMELLKVTANNREQILLQAVQNYPSKSSAVADEYRLDILLEDYLDEAMIYNEFGVKLHRLELSPLPFIDLHLVLAMPHHLRLDLSVLLTISVLFSVPEGLFTNTLLTLYHQCFPIAQLQSFVQLPAFARTALVSLIRRVCRRELRELEHLRGLTIKPSSRYYCTNACEPSLADFTDPVLGFHFLRPIKAYLHRPLETLAGNMDCQGRPYSELELELMRFLPDCPTRSMMTGFDPSSVHHSNWLSLAARHVVLLMTKSSLFPSLTRSQTNSTHQALYDELLPLLHAASMTYRDLDISFTGPQLDGRVVKDASCVDSGAGNVLKFGRGLPQGNVSSLLWNSSAMAGKLGNGNDNGAVSPQAAAAAAQLDINDSISTGTSVPFSPRDRFESVSKEKSVVRSSAVQAFSFDLAWDPHFVLAPHELLKNDNRWNKLSEPPVLLDPMIPNELKSSKPSLPSQSVPSRAAYPPPALAMSSMSTYSATSSVENHSVSSSAAAGLSEAQSQLLAEMGTTRNLLRLGRDNASREQVSKGNHKKVKEMINERIKRERSKAPHSQDIPVRQPLILPALDEGHKQSQSKLFSWRNFVSSSRSPSVSQSHPTTHGDEPTFLTCDGDFEAVEKAEQSQQQRQEEQEEEKMLHSDGDDLSIRRSFIEHSGYPNVYHFHQGFQPGSQSYSGKCIAVNWYPQPNKVVYRLSKDQVTSAIASPQSNSPSPTFRPPKESVPQSKVNRLALEMPMSVMARSSSVAASVPRNHPSQNSYLLRMRLLSKCSPASSTADPSIGFGINLNLLTDASASHSITTQTQRDMEEWVRISSINQKSRHGDTAPLDKSPGAASSSDNHSMDSWDGLPPMQSIPKPPEAGKKSICEREDDESMSDSVSSAKLPSLHTRSGYLPAQSRSLVSLESNAKVDC